MERLTDKDIDYATAKEFIYSARFNMEHLQRYENTGLKPQEILKLTEELQEYKRKEEQGLLIELPCKVGTRVYQILEVENRDGALEALIIIKTFFLPDHIGKLGKTVFLTKEQAEQALKESDKVSNE